MKKNYKKLALVLTFIPFLMGNSPAPRREVISETYEDIELSFISEGTDYINYYRYYNLKNIGTGYIDYLGLYSEDGTYHSSMTYEEFTGPFQEILLPPGFEQQVRFLSGGSAKYAQGIHPICSAYNNFDEFAEVRGTGELTIRSKHEEFGTNPYVHCEYRLDYDMDYYNGDFCYAAIVEITYDGVPYYLKFGAYNGFAFYTSAELDLSKTSVKVMGVVRSKIDQGRYTGYSGITNAINAILIFFAVAFAILISFGIFAAIFFPTMARRRRKRLLEATKK